jgi:hypothetical protein
MIFAQVLRLGRKRKPPSTPQHVRSGGGILPDLARVFAWNAAAALLPAQALAPVEVLAEARRQRNVRRQRPYRVP